MTDYTTTPGDLDLMVRVAEKYYIENKTQAQIAKQLGISSSTVSRLLNRAREEGIVRITIVPQNRNRSLEGLLCQRYNLKEAVVANIPAHISDENKVRQIIGYTAASYIDSLIKPEMVIGVGQGRVLAELVNALEGLASPRKNKIIQIFGADNMQRSPTRSVELTRILADMYSGVAYYLNAPALVDDKELADKLLTTSVVSEVLPFYEKLDLALLGIGQLRGSPLELNGLLRPDQVDQLEAAGAVGDICGHFFTKEGQLVDEAYSGRAIGATWEQLQRCPCLIAISCGSEKVHALGGILEAGLLQILITDELTAQEIIAITA